VSDGGEYAIDEQRKRCFAVVEAKMKLLIFLAISLNQLAWSQLQTGTVIYINFAQGEVTISADSRMNIVAGGHDDTECKISAFGSKFVFSMAGAARIDQWNAHSVAREIWERESKIHFDATLLARTVKGWIEAVEPIYGIHVAEIRKHMNSGDAPVIATAFFAAADKAGTIKVQAVKGLHANACSGTCHETISRSGVAQRFAEGALAALGRREPPRTKSQVQIVSSGKTES
jgi:hypothetical protein